VFAKVFYLPGNLYEVMMADERDILCYNSGLHKRYESVPQDVVDDVIESRNTQVELMKKSILVAMASIGGLSIVLHIFDVVSLIGVSFSFGFIAVMTVILYLFPTEEQIKPTVVSDDAIEAISDDIQYRIQYEEVHNPPKRIMFDVVGERVYSNFYSILPI
jgi:hypothetical protein